MFRTAEAATDTNWEAVNLAHLEPDPEEFKTAENNHETCFNSLEKKNSDLEAVSREKDQLENELQSLSQEKSNLDNLVLEIEDNLDTIRGEKDQVLMEKEEIASENERLQQVLAEKTELVEHLEMTNTNLMSDVEEARTQLSTQQKTMAPPLAATIATAAAWLPGEAPWPARPDDPEESLPWPALVKHIGPKVPPINSDTSSHCD